MKNNLIGILLIINIIVTFALFHRLGSIKSDIDQVKSTISVTKDVVTLMSNGLVTKGKILTKHGKNTYDWIKSKIKIDG